MSSATKTQVVWKAYNECAAKFADVPLDIGAIAELKRTVEMTVGWVYDSYSDCWERETFRDFILRGMESVAKEVGKGSEAAGVDQATRVIYARGAVDAMNRIHSLVEKKNKTCRAALNENMDMVLFADADGTDQWGVCTEILAALIIVL